MFGVFVHVFSTFVSANVFYLVLNKWTGFAQTSVAENALGFQWLATATAAMMTSHYFLYSLLTSSFLKVESNYSFSGLWKKNFAWTAGSYLLAAVAALATHLLFLEFGLAFGLVILPSVIVAHTAYKIHVRRLAQRRRKLRKPAVSTCDGSKRSRRRSTRAIKSASVTCADADHAVGMAVF